MHRVKVRVVEDALDANNTIARANRDDFDRHGVTVVNLMSAPGAGKTTLLERALGGLSVRVGRARGRRAGQPRRRPARLAARAGRAAQHRQRLRRRVPPGREHGPLGAARAAAGGDRPADRRERRQPRLPGRVPDRRGRADHGLLGRRGRGQAAQVPADVPRLRAGRDQQARPAPARRLRHGALPAPPRRGPPRRRDDAAERAHGRGRRGVPRRGWSESRCARRRDARPPPAARRRAGSSTPRPSGSRGSATRWPSASPPAGG